MSLAYTYEIYAQHHLAELRREACLEALRAEARRAAGNKKAARDVVVSGQCNPPQPLNSAWTHLAT